MVITMNITINKQQIKIILKNGEYDLYDIDGMVYNINDDVWSCKVNHMNVQSGNCKDKISEQEFQKKYILLFGL